MPPPDLTLVQQWGQNSGFLPLLFPFDLGGGGGGGIDGSRGLASRVGLLGPLARVASSSRRRLWRRRDRDLRSGSRPRARGLRERCERARGARSLLESLAGDGGRAAVATLATAGVAAVGGFAFEDRSGGARSAPDLGGQLRLSGLIGPQAKVLHRTPKWPHRTPG